MNSTNEVKQLLKESGNIDLWADETYNDAVLIAKMMGKKDIKLKQFCQNLEGMKEQHMHDTIVKNRELILSRKVS